MAAEIPKQFVDFGGKMMITHCLKPFGESKLVDNILIVASEQWRDKINSEIIDGTDTSIKQKFMGFSDPGENRQLSIWNALKDIAKALSDADKDDGRVIVHDAARHFVTVECIGECLKTLEDHDGAMSVLPMNDTVYFSRDGKHVDELLMRSCIYAGQAPEAFLFHKYYLANEELPPDKIKLIKGSTEPAIMAGLDVAMIPGDQHNFKITTKEDLDRAMEILIPERRRI